MATAAAAQDNPMTTLMSPDEAARYLGVTVQTLAAWRWKKVGPPYRKVGRRVRYDPTELDSWTKATQ